MIRLLLTFALLFIIVANAEEEGNCRLIPYSFSVVMDPLEIDPQTEKLSAYSMIHLYYDYPMQRMRLDVVGFQEDKKEHSTVWIVFKDNKGQVLRFDRESGQCSTNTTERKMQKPEIPKGSKFLTTLQRGSTITEMWKINHPKQRFSPATLVDLFTHHNNQANNDNNNPIYKNATMIAEIEQGSCIPVGIGVFRKENEEEDLEAYEDTYDISKFRPLFFMSFANFHSGVNENLFDMPAACAKYPEQIPTIATPAVVDNMLSMLETLFSG